MSGAPERAPGEPGWTRWLPVLLVPAALAGDLGAGLPLRSYYFRDLTIAFMPLRIFAAQELQSLRLAFWNPYVAEGAFHVSLYPLDQLHALWPSPVFVSWMLTLHLPLAALGAYWLARQLGASRGGSFVSGMVFALGGFALSCLNLYVFLQALALAPFVVGLLRRAALEGGRWTVLAAAVLGGAISTLAVEFVGQAVLLGAALGLLETRARALPRLGLSIALGVGLAGVPVAVILGVLPETVRGAGFASDVVLGNAVHPVVLLQVLLPHLFGLPAAPAEAWWGARFFNKGTPYFLSLYLGPVVLGLAALGLGKLRRGVALTLAAASAAGLWFALGEHGGLAAAAQQLPFASSFRFPSKALLLPHLGIALAAGFGAARLRQDGRAFRRLASIVGVAAGLGGLVLAALWLAPRPLVAWSGVRADYWTTVVGVTAVDAGMCSLLAAGTALLAVAARRGLIGSGAALAALVALLGADLARAGAGFNRQVDASFFDLVPELAGLPLRDPEGGRVFSYGVDHSPAFRALLSSGGRNLTLAAFFISRQMLVPLTNVLERVECPEGKELGFEGRAAELGPELYDPSAIDRLVPWLRNAAVSRVISLDPLAHSDLQQLGEVDMGAPGMAVRVYRLKHPWPRVYLACRLLEEPDAGRALLRPYAADFDPAHDVALAGASAPGCARGEAWERGRVPGRERYETAADGPGYLVVRASFARGWTAWVDGRRAPVLRANGKHLAVPVRGGRHDVVLQYRPPGLRAGLAAFAGSGLVCLALLVSSRRRGRSGRGRAEA